MGLDKFKIIAFATLVRAEKYVLEEKDKKFDYQILVEEDYKIAVSEYIAKNS